MTMRALSWKQRCRMVPETVPSKYQKKAQKKLDISRSSQYFCNEIRLLLH